MNISSLNNPSVSTNVPGNKTAGTPTDADKLASKTGDFTPGGKNSVVTASTILSVSFEDKRQTALQIVNRTLAQAYEKISSRGQAASAEYETFEPLTAEKVASNILGFIERRLQMDVADGASQEELQARLEAGLAGFKKGFAEASEKLEALSLLSPEIKADIGKTYDLVLEGVDELRAKFIQSTTEQIPASPSKTESEIVKTAAPKASSPAKLDVPDFLPAAGAVPAANSYMGYGNYEYGRAREFSFELRTKEGDIVTIKASSSEGFAVEAGRASRGNQSVSAMNASYSSSESFSFSIEGELNEDELAAINDLLGRVNDLAGQFFEGNLDSAFEQAMNLGYDAEQIGSFSLNLAQAEIQQVTQAYQTFEPGNNAGGIDKPALLTDQLLPLGNFIKNLLDSLDRASIFDEPKSLLSGMAEKITGEGEMDQLQGKRFRDFIEEMFALELR
ncbi:DUF5610 domain-containing protein [Cellvibrio sp. UBA7661]|uniref:DUF5610 domain-containing protein n=1 Tax=Cellvibrio sp. UBA7661 TaxID=1946311 RepID=UPI002F34F855